MNERSLSMMKTALENEDWQEIHRARNAEEAYNYFLRTITSHMDTICPRKRITRRKNKTYTFSDEEARTLKDRYLYCLRKYELTGSETDKEAKNEAKKNYDLRLKMLRRKRSTEFIQNSDNKSKAIWQIINGERNQNDTDSTQIEMEINGEKTKDLFKITNHLNQYFTSIAEETLNAQPRNMPTRNNHNIALAGTGHDLLQFSPTNYEEIKTIIKSFKPKTSAGLDDISAKLLKYCSTALISPLASITNLSLSQGHFPSAMKQTKVYPKYKSGPQTEPNNFRPISLIPTFSKVIERVVLKRLMDHCEKFSLLTDSQHGFLKGRSTTTAIIKFAEYIIDNLEEKNLVTSIMLDFSKAFDCLGHDLILQKLERLGIKGTARAWLASYLEERSQLVEIKHTIKGVTQTIRSSPLPNNRGVPQGSVLGPVLYILLTNDMPDYLREHCTTVMYADDTTLLISGKSSDILSVESYTAVNMAYQYCQENDLAVNKRKSKQLAFGRKRDEVPELPEMNIENEAKFLGITIDENISWDSHINNLSKKLNSSLYALKRIKNVSDATTAQTAYHALFESHLRYGVTIWGSTKAGNLQRILLLQKRAVRILTGLDPRDSCREAFVSLQIMTVIALYIREVILYIDKTPQQRRADFHRHDTRYGSKFNVPPHRSSLFEKKTSYNGCKFHNQLPDHIRNLQGQKLKKALSEWLVNRPFYTKEEFLNWRVLYP